MNDTFFVCSDATKSPPLGLLECIVDWISADPCLCSDSVRLIRIRSSFTCPVNGLVRWCVLGPLVTLTKSSSSSESKQNLLKPQSSVPGLSPQKSKPEVIAKQTEDSITKILELFSKLHLGLLMSLQSYKSMELNQELFTFGDLYILAKVLQNYHMIGAQSDQITQLLSVCVDRLAQVIQVSLQTRSLHGEFLCKSDQYVIIEPSPLELATRCLLSKETSFRIEYLDSAR